MRSYLLTIVLIFSLSLTACKAKKVVTSGHTEEQLAMVENTGVTSASASVSALTSISTLNDDVDITQVVTVFSAPDSAGKQHKTQVTETKAIRKTRNKQLATSNSKFETIEIDTTKKDVNTKLETTSTQTETPRGQGWKIWTAIILSLGLVFLAYLILRRFGLVKPKGGVLGRIFKNNRI